MNSTERREARYRRRHEARRKKILERSKLYANPDVVFSTSAIVRGFKKTSKISNWKPSTKRFKMKLFVKARNESKRLLDGSWRSRGIKKFVIVERGHTRNIQNVHISEKSIQSVMSNECLIPIIKPSLIYDNGASMEGKGTSFALDRFEKHLRSHLRKYGRTGSIFFFDFKKFFEHIRQARIYKMLENKVLSPEIMKVYFKFLDEMGRGPLETAEGLGLGSQVFQISAIFYPNPLDHWIKDELRIKYYGRFMDDGYVIFESQEEAKEFKERFYEKCEECEIVPNKEKCQIVKLTSNFIFLKRRYFITESLKIVKRANPLASKRERRKLKKLRQLFIDNKKTFEEIRNEFHAWLCGLTCVKSFHVILNMIGYFNNLFDGYGEYKLTKLPSKKQRKTHHMLKYAIRLMSSGDPYDFKELRRDPFQKEINKRVFIEINKDSLTPHINSYDIRLGF